MGVFFLVIYNFLNKREAYKIFDNVITNVYTVDEGCDFMNTQLKKIGNSKGVIIPTAILKMLDIKESVEFTVKVVGKDIILTKVNSFDPKSLEELFLDYTETYEGEIIFDDTKGREVW